MCENQYCLFAFATLVDLIADNREMPQNLSQPLSMSGNGSDNVGIPSVFITHLNGKVLSELLEQDSQVLIRLQEMEITSTGEFVINQICTLGPKL